AFSDNFAAHQARQAARNGQAEPGAAVHARAARIGLFEFIKNHIEFVRCNADAGVGDGNRHATVRRVRLQTHAAALGELRGVAQQVDYDLQQLLFIDKHRRQGGVYLLYQLYCIGLDQRLYGADATLQHLRKVNLGGIDLDTAGLDLGEIEDGID